MPASLQELPEEVAPARDYLVRRVAYVPPLRRAPARREPAAVRSPLLAQKARQEVVAREPAGLLVPPPWRDRPPLLPRAAGQRERPKRLLVLVQVAGVHCALAKPVVLALSVAKPIRLRVHPPDRPLAQPPLLLFARP